MSLLCDPVADNYRSEISSIDIDFNGTCKNKFGLFSLIEIWGSWEKHLILKDVQ